MNIAIDYYVGACRSAAINRLKNVDSIEHCFLSFSLLSILIPEIFTFLTRVKSIFYYVCIVMAMTVSP
jgi:hypothetical protein